MNLSVRDSRELEPRHLGRIRTLAPPARGQFGPDHSVVEVITPEEWVDADPFILLMDDRLDGTLRAGPHPHAGFETVTFMVEGSMAPEKHGAERGGEPPLGPGDAEWTTAGSGIVHGPDAPIRGKMRALQLWLTLPKALRWTTPDHQFVRRASALTYREDGAEVRLYSGSALGLTAPTRNRVPVTMTDTTLLPGARITQVVPRSYNGFLYVLEGEARVGTDHGAGAAARRLTVGQIGWLERLEGNRSGETMLCIENGASDRSLRVLFYAGERQNVPLAWYGPFVGDMREDIARSFERYRAGEFVRV